MKEKFKIILTDKFNRIMNCILYAMTVAIAIIYMTYWNGRFDKLLHVLLLMIITPPVSLVSQPKRIDDVIKTVMHAGNAVLSFFLVLKTAEFFETSKAVNLLQQSASDMTIQTAEYLFINCVVISAVVLIFTKIITTFPENDTIFEDLPIKKILPSIILWLLNFAVKSYISSFLLFTFAFSILKFPQEMFTQIFLCRVKVFLVMIVIEHTVRKIVNLYSREKIVTAEIIEEKEEVT